MDNINLDYNELSNTKKYTQKADSIRENSSPSPTKSMIFFFIISVLYLILNIYNIISSSSIEHVVENSNNNIFIVAYVIILIIGMYFINLGISKDLCRTSSPDYNNVFFATFLPWLIVFGILYFILEIFSGWAKPFSNTIGYFIVNFLGLENILKKMLNQENNDVKTAIEKINNNICEFINEFDVNHTQYTEFIKKLQAEGITKSSSLDLNNVDENEIELFKLINIKHLIGKIVWYFLAGTVIAAISYNNIINQACVKSTKMEDLDEELEDLDEELEELDEE